MNFRRRSSSFLMLSFTSSTLATYCRLQPPTVVVFLEEDPVELLLQIRRNVVGLFRLQQCVVEVGDLFVLR